MSANGEEDPVVSSFDLQQKLNEATTPRVEEGKEDAVSLEEVEKQASQHIKDL